jgi:hypothetical protein
MVVASVEERLGVGCLLFVHRDDTLTPQGLASVVDDLSTAFPPLAVGFAAPVVFAGAARVSGLRADFRVATEAV